MQLIRQEQTSSWPWHWTPWVLRGSRCKYLCPARWVRACPGGAGVLASLILISCFWVEEHNKESKSHISAHL